MSKSSVWFRFHECYVKRSSGCWEWVRGLTRAGYGQLHVPISLKKRITTITAHRRSWELHKGVIPAGLHVLHKCDNPKCVRPGHLFLGTNADNVRDRVRKGRRSGPAPSYTPATEARVRQLRRKGLSIRAIARAVGISPHAKVQRILAR